MSLREQIANTIEVNSLDHPTKAADAVLALLRERGVLIEDFDQAVERVRKFLAVRDGRVEMLEVPALLRAAVGFHPCGETMPNSETEGVMESVWRGPLREGETLEATITVDRGDGWQESFGAVRVDGVLIEDFDAAVEEAAWVLVELELERGNWDPMKVARAVLLAALGKEKE